MKAGGLHILQRLRARRSDGFTIVETMIVLAVTGVLFVSVMAVMSGRQSKTQFNQSVNALKTEIEQVIGEVQSGYFPDSGNFTCTDGIASGITETEQGTNASCVFLGKVVQFTDNNDEAYKVHTVAGKKDGASIKDSSPGLISSLEESKRLQFGLDPTQDYSFAILTRLDAGGSDVIYGSQTTQVIPLGTQPIGSMTTFTPGEARLCFLSGTTAQSAVLTVNGNSVTMDVKNNKDCS